MEISNFCIYRYIDNSTKEILYVEKTDSSLINRIKQHRSEDKFKNIDAHIEYVELENSMETRFYEFYFINKWKPELNTSDKYDAPLDVELADNLEWKPFDTNWLIESKKRKKKKIRELSEEEKQELANGYMYFYMHILPMDGFSVQRKRIFWFICTKLDFATHTASFSLDELEMLFPELSCDEIFDLVVRQTFGIEYLWNGIYGGINYITYIKHKKKEKLFECRFNARLDEIALRNYIDSYSLEDFD